MLIAVFVVVVGLALLVWGADRFVDGAVAAARNLGVSPLVAGLILVGFGTSAPEMVVSAMAAWGGNTGISIGNAVGSNITNIALVIGAAALMRPLTIHSRLLRRELPILIAAMLVALAMLADGDLGRLDGLVLLCGFAMVVYWMLRAARAPGTAAAGDGDALAVEFAGELSAGSMSTARALAWTAAGLVVLLVSSRMLVWGAVEIAQLFGVSDLIIGLTVVAVGTSLPELAATVSAALKGEDDIAIGNVVGSNTFNILAVLGLPGLIGPGPFAPEVLSRDFPVMIALTVAFVVMAYGFRGEGRVNRIEGALLLGAFVGYLGWLGVG
jgi:cation:H+ antiporter